MRRLFSLLRRKPPKPARQPRRDTLILPLLDGPLRGRRVEFPLAASGELPLWMNAPFFDLAVVVDGVMVEARYRVDQHDLGDGRQWCGRFVDEQ
ncbi:hypothetical protein [Saccharothrix hoggarensis]|uniref:Uncharacterized protein n=1 Tax=Saccharothrix hoggarensis TaxID=913853 RepID=A0ABW3QHR1_9PSEU